MSSVTCHDVCSHCAIVSCFHGHTGNTRGQYFLLPKSGFGMNAWCNSYNDITTTQPVDEGFWDSKGNLQETKVKTLSYPYAAVHWCIHMRWVEWWQQMFHLQAVAGHYMNMSFDVDGSKFGLVYKASTAIHEPTMIFLSEQYYYPTGYNARLTTSLCSLWL